MKKIKAFLNRYINGTKGAISLFLAILMVPFVSIAGMLVNAGRVNSAVAVFDEALCNASDSTLGTYDKFLRSRFALMAVSQDVASGASKFGKPVTGYTADAFINDTFQYYMEKNLGALGNTYDSDTLSVAGVYPLADTDILKTSVLQSSKIIVPAKLAVDWGSIDDMLASLTKPFDALGTFANLLGDGADAVTALDKLIEAEDDLKEQINSCNISISEYNTAYNNFISAVNSYNTTIDNIWYWRGEVNRLTPIFADLEQKAASVTSQIESVKKQIEALKKDKSVDHSNEIAQLNTKLSTLETERETVAPGYSQTKSDLDNAKKQLDNNVKALPGKHSTVNTKKSEYYNKIIALRNAVKSTGDKAVAFQKAGKDLTSKGEELLSSSIDAGFYLAQESINKSKEKIEEENEYYSYQKKLADAEGRTEYSTHYYNMIQENESLELKLNNEYLKYSNSDKIIDSANKAANEVSGELDKFVERALETEFDNVYNELDALAVTVNGIYVPTVQEERKISNYAHYCTVDLPLSVDEVKAVIDSLEAETTSSVWDTFLIVVEFFKGLYDALSNLELWHDNDLNSVVDPNKYSSVCKNGLPSQKSAIYVSSYDALDATEAEQNKKMLQSYLDVDIYDVEGSEMSTLDQLRSHIDVIKSKTDQFKIRNIPDIWDAATGIVDCIIKLAGASIAESLKSAGRAIANRMYLVGYISYNTANRTTYKNSLFGLDKFDNSASSYLFKGAETEYIFKGEWKETKNQDAVFNSIWITRMLYNIIGVMKDPTVQALATSLGSVTFGIGTALTYILFVALEGLTDTIILVNGSTIPLLKSFIYLSPTGILKLVEKIFSLALTETAKQNLYDLANNAAWDLNEGIKNTALENGIDPGNQETSKLTYAEHKAQQKADAEKNKIKNIFDLDYTKSLQILLLLFGNNDKMIKRLADIIQMEGTYYYRGTDISKSKFDLAKSYTYLRAQGNFYSGAFLRVGDYEGSTSKNRVIYNGY